MANQNWNNQGSFYGNPNNQYQQNGNNGNQNYGQSFNGMNGFDQFMMMNMMNGSMLNMNMPPPNPIQQNNQQQNHNNNNNNNNINNNNLQQQNNMNNGGGNGFSLAFAPPPMDNNNNNNKQPPPNPMQQMQQQGSFYGNSFGMNAPINPVAMNPLQQMQQQGSFYANSGAINNNNNNNGFAMNNMNNMGNMNMNNNGFGNNGMPPPPPGQNGGGIGGNGVNYQYDQNLKPKKKKRKKKKKPEKKIDDNINNNNDNQHYGQSLEAPKGRKQKVGRIRNSFLMTGKHQGGKGFGYNQGGRGLLGALHQTGYKNGGGGGGGAISMSSKPSKTTTSNRDINALYSEKRKKKVSYSRKETDKMKSKLLSSDKNMKKLRDIKDIKQQNKLIMKKIHLCKYVCDFRAAGDSMFILDHKEKKRIENKFELLQELYEHLRRENWNNTMGDDLLKFLESLFKMISHNLFRVLPDPYIKEAIKTDTSGKDAKITISKELPSWKHLDLIYKIFECVLKKIKDDKQQKNAIIEYLENFNVISNVVYLLNTEEVREEECVANIISLLYSEYKPVRLFVLGQLSNVCYSYLYLNNRDLNIGSNLFEKNKNQKEYSKQLAVGVKTVLLIFRECLENADAEELDGWIELLCQVIIPLHKAPINEFILFDDALGKISITFCEKYFLSFIYIFQGMLRYWPITSSKKEQLFLHRISPLLDKADEDIWEFKDKLQCEFHNVFTKLSHKIVDAIKQYTHCHYATAEKIFEMLEDDTLQRFLDIYGGKDCWIKLYKGLYDISTKFFWKETIDKCKEFMENCKEEDDIPMQYVQYYQKIENQQLYKNHTPFDIQQKKLKQKRINRKKYWANLDKKYQRKNVAKYQQQVYKNNQPMLRLKHQASSHEFHQPSVNWNSDAMKELTTSLGSLIDNNNNNHSTKKSKYKVSKKHKVNKTAKKSSSKKRSSGKTKLPSQPNKGGLPTPAIWDDDDF